MTQTLRASFQPLAAIEKVSYEGQPEHMKRYKSGYENFFNRLPVIKSTDQCLMKNISDSQNVFRELGEKLQTEDWVISESAALHPKEFSRSIIGLEEPIIYDDYVKQGKEIIVSKWGDGFSSPIHGHVEGYTHEYLIHGKLLISSYWMPYTGKRIVRYLQQKLYDKPGDLITGYFKSTSGMQRDSMIHSLKSIGNSASLHYVPEHSRDGNGNTFELEQFDNFYDPQVDDFKQVSSSEVTKNAIIGDVIMVRSDNVPYLGTRYIVITGPAIIKEYGLRREDIVIPAVKNNILDRLFHENRQLVLLKLTDTAKKAFHDFHGITVENNVVNLKNQ